MGRPRLCCFAPRVLEADEHISDSSSPDGRNVFDRDTIRKEDFPTESRSDALIHQKVLEAATKLVLGRSASVSQASPTAAAAKKMMPPLPRASSSRSRSMQDQILPSGDLGKKQEKSEDMLIQEKVLEAATALVMGRSTSVRQGSPISAVTAGGGGKKRMSPLPRTSSSRPRSITDQILLPENLMKQEPSVKDLETNHFVLVHGGGFGAWCWYKSIALLRDDGFKVNAVDLTGSGVHTFDTNNITSLAKYVEPLTSFIETIRDGDKVILVGHDFGGACISYAMEAFPSKVAKAVFVSASMPMNGQSTLNILSNQEGTNDLMRQSQIFQYANGKDHPPTAIDLDKSMLDDLLFNQTPSKDVALASVSMRPIPFAPILEKLSLSAPNYGSVRRFYIETMEDNAIPLSVQESMCSSNPPERVFQLKGSDHSPFFSKPQSLHKILVEIANLPANERAAAVHESETALS
ncbi:putative methylesterase 11, chloroplastic [Iris pallida]|uniref:Methylesterase 11, chloroplastic n=1 Tax=Iris pallida TaxID=29817 RepID=A0AAX6DU87_IRIPA|nr:putative methylesterase 11, chloroplastic [Iris pallida]KAJ6835337.1 putative methylesterase 11, chloroplastic [Iris pallida]